MAPDKFRGTAEASEVAEAMSAVFGGLGIETLSIAMSDGGEGLTQVFSWPERTASVTRCDGGRVNAAYKFDGETAVMEMASVAGLGLVGGPERNDPLRATTRGVGELVKDAVFAGAVRVIVGCGGSATTDGGLGAVEALEPVVRLKGIDLVAAYDVDIMFAQAATLFSAQKGASPAQVALLERRLEALEGEYLGRFGVDVSTLTGSGAAGGLAGGLAAVGGRLVSGFEIVAEVTGFYEALDEVDLVVTGEGYLDRLSFHGKVVGSVIAAAASKGIPCLVIAGDSDPGIGKSELSTARVYSLVGLVGEELALGQTRRSVEETLHFALRSESLL